MTDRTVTLIVTPCERFGVARESLLSIFGVTQTRFELIYVDYGADADFSGWLDEQAGRRGFRIVRPGLVAPNQARNLGLKLASSRFVVFIDNDVIVAPGWLDALLDCAIDEQADIVSPLTCQGRPLHTTVLCAGGSLLDDPIRFFAQPTGHRQMAPAPYYAGRRLADIAAQLRRGPVGSGAFHCLLVRRSLFDWIGPLDERLLTRYEHLDLCLAATQAAKRIVFEPAAIVTRVLPSRQRPLTRTDWRYFLLRGSPQWAERSRRHWQIKWGLQPDAAADGQCEQSSNRHRCDGLIGPLLQSIPGSARSAFWRRFCQALLMRGFDLLGATLVRSHQRRQQRPLEPPVQNRASVALQL